MKKGADMVRSRVVAAMLLVGFCLSTALWAESPKELRKVTDEEIAKIKAAMPDKAVAQPAQPRKMLSSGNARRSFIRYPGGQ
jgi:hypothetical protein